MLDLIVRRARFGTAEGPRTALRSGPQGRADDLPPRAPGAAAAVARAVASRRALHWLPMAGSWGAARVRFRR